MKMCTPKVIMRWTYRTVRRILKPKKLFLIAVFLLLLLYFLRVKILRLGTFNQPPVLQEYPPSSTGHEIDQLPPIEVRSCSNYDFRQRIKIVGNVITFVPDPGWLPVTCNARYVLRKNETEIQLSHAKTLGSKGVTLTSQFVIVQCSRLSDNANLYRQYYPSILLQKNTEARIRRQILREGFPEAYERPLSVLLVCLGGVTRKQFLHYMPDTLKFIQQELVHVDFRRYSRCGTGAYPNIATLLTGMHKYRIRDAYNVPSDGLPFIWKDYAKYGYRTLFAEDLALQSLFANKNAKGFVNQPTDYYLRPLTLAVERDIGGWQLGCQNDRSAADVVLQWTEDFMATFLPEPVFAFAILSRLNPALEIKKAVPEVLYQDGRIRNFLLGLHRTRILEQSLTFVFSDGAFPSDRGKRNASQGDDEPFLFLLLPSWFPNRFPRVYRNLKTNANRFVIPADVYATLLDVLHMHNGHVNDFFPIHLQGVSLIDKELPSKRP